MISKKSGDSMASLNAESAKSSRQQRADYRRRYHEKNREKENEANRRRYHEKYKTDPAWMKRRRQSWKTYAAKRGKKWNSERQKKYGNRNKPSSELSPSSLSKKRAAYRRWAKANWDRRVEYAKEYRKRNPTFGLRSKIGAARKSGDLGKLAEECLAAIVRSYEKDH